MPRYLSNIDLSKNELQNAKIHVLSSAPSSPAAGQVYYNSSNANLYVYTGSSWVDLTVQGADSATTSTEGIIQLAGDLTGTSTSPTIANGAVTNAKVASNAAIALSKLATDPLARANHTGSQTASTISDLATTVQAYRLDQFASPTNNVSLGSNRITSLADPSSAQDAATKAYVDATKQGLDVKESVRVATTANITLSSTQTIDGVSVSAGDRVLVKNQTTGADNGIYTVAAGSWSRSTDANADSEVTGGLFVFVEEGTSNADSGWVLTTNNPITVGTTSLAFTQFSGAGQITAGDGLTKTGNTIDVVAADTTMSVTANAIGVSLNGTGGLEDSSGVRVKLDGSTLSRGSAGLKVSDTYSGNTSITSVGTVTTGTWNATDIAVADGGTGASTASSARSNLSAAGYYTSATHSSGTSISITQSTHGLRASRGLYVQAQDESTGEIVYPDCSVASNGDVTVSFASSQTANSIRVTIVG